MIGSILQFVIDYIISKEKILQEQLSNRMLPCSDTYLVTMEEIK